MTLQRLSPADLRFPEALRQAQPVVGPLYLRGRWPNLPLVAIVGTRKASPYGRACVRLLAPELVRLGFGVLSGLAFGIDAEAHTCALDAGGTTVAVIGGGPDDASIYPRAHLGLARRMLEDGGAILSEYPPGTGVRKHHFPARNRIVAALARAVIVVEAPEKSGALITARLAMELGTDVLAVPGPITHPNSAGPNRLIRDGATPVTSTEDLAHALGVERAPDAAEQATDPSVRDALRALKSGADTIDALALALDLPPHEAAALLTSLELRGQVRPIGGGRYSLYSVA